MSNIAAYIGSPLLLENFLSSPDNSLFRQSVTTGNDGRNSNGFGVGWFNRQRDAATYVSPGPIWQDHNLPDLMDSLDSNLWLGHIQSGFHSHSRTVENCQPFRSSQLLWAFDGEIKDFRSSLRPHCLRYLSTPVEAEIRGHTESEFLFALLRQRMSEQDGTSAPAALADIMSTLEVALRDVEAQLNVIMSDGQYLYAVRHSAGMPCRPLYFTENDRSLSPDAKMVASTPMTRSSEWQEIPEHHFLVLGRERPAELMRL